MFLVSLKVCLIDCHLIVCNFDFVFFDGEKKFRFISESQNENIRAVFIQSSLVFVVFFRRLDVIDFNLHGYSLH